MIKFQFPLQWLPQQPRTKKPQWARFKTKSISRAGEMLADELRKFQEMMIQYKQIKINLELN